MATISWYDTLEGKLAMCFALLLVLFGVVLEINQNRGTSQQGADARVLPQQQTPKTQASNLAELPPLLPYQAEPTLSQSLVPATPIAEDKPRPQVSEHSTDNSNKPDSTKPGMFKLIFP